MQTTYATASAPGFVNEDYVICGSTWAMILDGATAPSGVDSGCLHDVPWLVRQLSAATARNLLLLEDTLSDILARSIEEVTQSHSETCDLDNPDSPSTTISIVRMRGRSLDYLTLGDSPIAIRTYDNKVVALMDDRTAHLPGGRPYPIELVRTLRNKPNGFWIASTNPEAAYHAITGSLEIAQSAEIGIFTDGVTRLIDFYGYSWDSLFSLLREVEPVGLIDAVRSAERSQRPPYGKLHDDASAVHVVCDLSWCARRS